MRITTKSRFAVAAMTDIALRDHAGPVSLADISRRHQISVSYLEQMFSGLRQQGLVESTRGHGGGYRLGRAPQHISVADIINAVSDASRRSPVTPAIKSPAHTVADTLAEDLWTSLDAKMAEHMHSIKLSALVSEQLAKGVRVEARASKSRGILKKPATTPVASTAANSVFAWGRTLRTQG